MAGIVHVIVFTNFEGFAFAPAPAMKWFAACAKAHPQVRWTHMYNPRYLLVTRPSLTAVDAQAAPFLLDAVARGTAEVGLHLHMFYDLVRQIGVEPRAFPYADDATPECDHRRTIAEDRRGTNGGYDVLLTGYGEAERAALLEACIASFVRRGLPRPVTFCAGYSAADPALQALLSQMGFTTSLAAQALGPKDYGPGWYKLLPWFGHISPLTIPYRVHVHSILPPPHDTDNYLDLVEVPLNMACDKNDLYLGPDVVRREDRFDLHYRWARDRGQETAVAIGIHAEVIAKETWESGPVARVLNQFLKHAAARAKETGAEIRYSLASHVAQRFWNNKTIGSIADDPRPPM